MSETKPAGDSAAMEQASRRLATSAAEVTRLRQAVESDHLRLDPAAGQEIRSLLEDQLSHVDTWLKQAANLTRHAPLGTNPVAAAMAAKFANRADGDENSFAAVLAQYREVLMEAHDAVSDAMRRYEEIDGNAAESMRKLIQ